MTDEVTKALADLRAKAYPAPTLSECCDAPIGDGEHYAHGRCSKCGEAQ